MARKYIVGGRIFEESGERKAIVGGKILQDTTPAFGMFAPAPRLWSPGVKPGSHPKIDWENTLTKKLCACFYPTAFGFEDLVLRTRSTADSSTSRLTKGSLAREYDGTKQTTLDYNSKYSLLGPSGSSIGVIVDVDALSNDLHFIAQQASTTTHGWELRGQAAGKGLIHRAHATGWKQFTGNSGTFAAGDKHVPLVCVMPNNQIHTTPYFLVKDGNLKIAVAPGGSGTGAITDSSSAEVKIGRRLDGGTRLDGGIHIVCLWDRPLSAAEAKSFAKNPYQILRPMSWPA